MTEPTSSQRIGAQLRRARLEAGLTQRELAARLKRSRSWVSATENATRNIYLNELDQITEAIGIDVLIVLDRSLAPSDGHAESPMHKSP